VARQYEMGVNIWGVYNSWKSWKSAGFPGKFNCELKYDNMPITEQNLVTSLNPRNCHLTFFCSILFTMSYITESACVCIPVVILRRFDQCKNPAGTLLNVSWKFVRLDL